MRLSTRISEREESGAAPGFDDPLGLLAACHLRIEAQCAALLRIQAHVRVHAWDPEAQAAADRVHRYFLEAGRWHHEDEEEDLAPLLSGKGDPTLRAIVADLRVAHRRLEDAYGALAEGLLGRLENPKDLPVQPFVSLMRDHLAAEDRLILPQARALLVPSEIRRLGAAMARRRGLKSPASRSHPQAER